MLDYSLSVAMRGNGRGPAYEVIPDPGTLNVICGYWNKDFELSNTIQLHLKY